MTISETFNELMHSFAEQREKVYNGNAPLASLNAFVQKFAGFQPLPFASQDSRLQTLVSVLIEMCKVLKTQKAETSGAEIAREESLILALKLLTQLLADAPSPQPYGAVWMSLANALVERQEGSVQNNIDEAVNAYDTIAASPICISFRPLITGERWLTSSLRPKSEMDQ